MVRAYRICIIKNNPSREVHLSVADPGREGGTKGATVPPPHLLYLYVIHIPI